MARLSSSSTSARATPLALKAQETLSGSSPRPGDAADAVGVLGSIRLAVKGTAAEEAHLKALLPALKTIKDKALLDYLALEAKIAAQGLAEETEKEFPSLKKANVASGVRVAEDSWRVEFKLRHYRELRAEIAAAAAKAKAPTAAQRAAEAPPALLLLESLATAAGVLPATPPARSLLSSSTIRSRRATGSSPRRVQRPPARSRTTRRRWRRPPPTARCRLRQGPEAAYARPAGSWPLCPPWRRGRSYRGLGAAYRPGAIASRRLAWWPHRARVHFEVAIARNRRIALSAQRMATAVNGGSFRSRFIGPGGTDFAEARPYLGEDMREIDWKTSAKKDELYAKKFELERDMPLMLVIDISRSGSFGTRGSDKRTVIEDAAAMLAMAAAHSNIRVGAIFVSDRVELVFPARGGSRHAMTIVNAILKAEPTGTATDLKPGLEAAGKFLASRGMVAVLSDFIGPDFKDALGALASRHDVRAIRVTDPAEMGPLPDVGLLPVVDAETGATRMLDTSSRAGRAEAGALSRREAAVENAF